jgi:hypothetical protein
MKNIFILMLTVLFVLQNAYVYGETKKYEYSNNNIHKTSYFNEYRLSELSQNQISYLKSKSVRYGVAMNLPFVGLAISSLPSILKGSSNIADIGSIAFGSIGIIGILHAVLSKDKTLGWAGYNSDKGYVFIDINEKMKGVVAMTTIGAGAFIICMPYVMNSMFSMFMGNVILTPEEKACSLIGGIVSCLGGVIVLTEGKMPDNDKFTENDNSIKLVVEANKYIGIKAIKEF